MVLYRIQRQESLISHMSVRHRKRIAISRQQTGRLEQGFVADFLAISRKQKDPPEAKRPDSYLFFFCKNILLQRYGWVTRPERPKGAKEDVKQI